MAIDNYKTAMELISNVESPSAFATSNYELHKRELYYHHDRELMALSVTDVMIRDALRLRGLMEQSIFTWIAADGCHEYYPDTYVISTSTRTAAISVSKHQTKRLPNEWMPNKVSNSADTDTRTRRRWTAVGEHTKNVSLSPISYSRKPATGDIVASDKINRYSY